MHPTGLHLLLTYRCLYRCDHCFVWGSPDQVGTMTAEDIDFLLAEAAAVSTIRRLYFEGGEPFLFYPVLLRGVRRAHESGFETGIVTNAFWATSAPDARIALRPFAGLVEDLSLSLDAYHGDEQQAALVENARRAARDLGIPAEVIRIAEPGCSVSGNGRGQLPPGTSRVRFRGRAARELAPRAPLRRWEEFASCEAEELAEPDRVHVDPFGYVHLCQGIAIGNVHRTPLARICAEYDPGRHPIAGPLLEGGPARLASRHGFDPGTPFADGCHLCYETRCVLRARYPEVLAPDAMYGDVS
jgi:MoaA/NifB/PqqE/SkfB family radical SAM enzyme